MYIFCIVLTLVVAVETLILVVGKEKAKKLLEGCLEEATGACTADLGRGLYYAEAADFVQTLKSFFQSVTLSDYVVDPKGWVCVTYTVGSCKVQDKAAVRKAIRIELHSYLLSNHGVNSWLHFVPVLTEDMLLIKFATSLAAEKEFQRLDFREETRRNVSLVDGENETGI